MGVIKMNYEDDFKLEVVKTYLESPHGIRVVARSFGLPSKNYIFNWIGQLKRKGLLPLDCEKITNKSSAKKKIEKADDAYQPKEKTAREKQLEKEILRLKAENDFLKKLQEIEGRNARNR
jgi:transposase